MSLKVIGYVAEETPVAVLLLRYTRKQTQLAYLSAHGRHVRLELGSLFFGRFFPNRCDLSPDGRHFLYFVMGGRPAEDGCRCWSAICRPPLLKADVFLPQEDTRGGGGRFLSNTCAVVEPGLQPAYNATATYESNGVSVEIAQRFERSDGWASGRGWTWIDDDRNQSETADDHRMSWSKTQGGVKLERYLRSDLAQAGDFQLHQYKISFERSDDLPQFEDRETVAWADFLSDGRLILTTQSRLMIFDASRKTMPLNFTLNLPQQPKAS